jgi:dTDP-4-amino-4,6-dideoxygalactose transaminase
MQSIPFNRPSITGRELDYIQDAIERGQLSGDGHYTKLCNKCIVEMTGAHAALLTHSCTAALEMAAILCGLVPGDEVILPSFTFVSTANAVVLRGATPVFVDIDPRTLNIDSTKAAEAITPKTKAVIAVHYAGIPADMDQLADICRAHNLLLIEDAAQALGSEYKGRKVGTLGDMAAFSFHETKNIISGEGGAITINRPELVQRAEIIREKGTNRSEFMRGMADKYSWVDIGSSFLPGELVAAFLYGQLENAETVNQERVALFNRYHGAFFEFEKTGRVTRPHVPDVCVGNGHMYYLLMRDRDDRDAFISHMKDRQINSPFHYVPLHSAPGGRLFGRTFGETLAATDSVSGRLVRLPMFVQLDEAIEEVIAVASDFLMSSK